MTVPMELRAGMKRRRPETNHWDQDNSSRMDVDATATATAMATVSTMASDVLTSMSCIDDGHDREEDSDDVEQPTRKRAMLIRANIRLLEKMPPLRNYHRARNGRRGGVDGGPLTGDMFMSALEESFEETSFVTMEPPSRAAVVAPVQMIEPVPSSAIHVMRPFHGTQPAVNDRREQRVQSIIDGATTTHQRFSAKDDEARPASK